MPKLSGIGSASVIGFGSRNQTNLAQFSFSAFTFNSAGKVGRYGPSINSLRSAYSSQGQSWASNSSYFFLGRAEGYQVWQVPQSGLYEIEIAGARGQNGAGFSGYGRGAIIRARVGLSSSDRLEMLIGQVPGNSGNTDPGTGYSGAGGGSFIVYYGTNTPILVAGGGAGSYGAYTTQSVVDGQTKRRPLFSGYSYSPISSGVDPAIGYGGPCYHGGGGGGFYGPAVAYPGRTIADGAMTTDPNVAGQSYTGGAGFVGSPSSASGDPIPGTWYGTGGSATNLLAEGGFGGGGGGHTGNNSGGGGGGYSGGPGGRPP